MVNSKWQMANGKNGTDAKLRQCHISNPKGTIHEMTRRNTNAFSDTIRVIWWVVCGKHDHVLRRN